MSPANSACHLPTSSLVDDGTAQVRGQASYGGRASGRPVEQKQEAAEMKERAASEINSKMEALRLGQGGGGVRRAAGLVIYSHEVAKLRKWVDEERAGLRVQDAGTDGAQVARASTNRERAG